MTAGKDCSATRHGDESYRICDDKMILGSAFVMGTLALAIHSTHIVTLREEVIVGCVGNIGIPAVMFAGGRVLYLSHERP